MTKLQNYLYNKILEYIIKYKYEFNLFNSYFDNKVPNYITIYNRETIELSLVCKDWFNQISDLLLESLDERNYGSLSPFLDYDFIKSLIHDNNSSSRFKLLNNNNKLFMDPCNNHNKFYKLEFINKLCDKFNRVVISISPHDSKTYPPNCEYSIYYSLYPSFQFKNNINNNKVNQMFLEVYDENQKLGNLFSGVVECKPKVLEYDANGYIKYSNIDSMNHHIDQSQLFQIDSIEDLVITGSDHVEPIAISKINNQTTSLKSLSVSLLFHEIIRAMNIDWESSNLVINYNDLVQNEMDNGSDGDQDTSSGSDDENDEEQVNDPQDNQDTTSGTGSGNDSGNEEEVDQGDGENGPTAKQVTTFNINIVLNEEDKDSIDKEELEKKVLSFILNKLQQKCKGENCQHDHSSDGENSNSSDISSDTDSTNESDLGREDYGPCIYLEDPDEDNEVESEPEDWYHHNKCNPEYGNILNPRNIKSDWNAMIDTLINNTTIEHLELSNSHQALCSPCKDNYGDSSIVSSSLKSLFELNSSIKTLTLYDFDFINSTILSGIANNTSIVTFQFDIKRHIVDQHHLNNTKLMLSTVFKTNQTIRNLTISWNSTIEDLIITLRNSSLKLYSLTIMFRSMGIKKINLFFDKVFNQLLQASLQITEFNILIENADSGYLKRYFRMMLNNKLIL